jgi:hypothetical protein
MEKKEERGMRERARGRGERGRHSKEGVREGGKEGFALRARICKLLRSPRIDSKETIPPGCVAWRAGTTALFLLGS